MAEMGFMAQLPLIFQYIQIFSYIAFAYIFGSVAVKGWRGYLPWYLKLAAKFGTGFVCLISGIALGPFIQGLNVGILQFMQLDVLTAGMVAGAVFAVGLYLFSFTSPTVVTSINRQIEKLRKKMSKMKGRKPNKKMQTAGVIVILFLVAVSLVYFRGFPSDMTSELFEKMGLPEEFGTMSQECMSTLTAAMSLTPEQLKNPPVYENPGLETEIESESNKTTVEMYRIEQDGEVVVIALTSDNQQCFATETEFCVCPPARGS